MHFSLDSIFRFRHNVLHERCADGAGTATGPRRIILQIRQLIADNPDWSRRRLSEVLCAEWDWRNGSGRLKDMATRTLLVKLDARGLITLPARRRTALEPHGMPGKCPGRTGTRRPVTGTLRDVGPLTLREVSTDAAARVRFAAALAEFHYLGYRGTVGENLQYMVTDQTGRLLACLLFGSAAWKCRARDQFIGWDPEQRAAESAPADQQHPLSDSALCPGSASGQLDSGPGAASSFGTTGRRSTVIRSSWSRPLLSASGLQAHPTKHPTGFGSELRRDEAARIASTRFRFPSKMFISTLSIIDSARSSRHEPRQTSLRNTSG